MRNRIQIVDMVRAAAILTVLIHHLGFQFITQPSPSLLWAFVWYKLWVNGGYGVTIFFVVSGFVITRLIASQPRPYGLFNPNFRDFYARRAGRILPLLATTCLLGLTVISLFPNPSHPFEYCFKNPQASLNAPFWLSIGTFTFYWYQLLAHSASAHYGLHWDILWSLSIEEQFYFCYPFLLKKLGHERNLRLLLVVLIFFPPVFAALHGFYFPNEATPVLGNLAPFGAIATGCLLFLAVRRFESFLSKNKTVSLVLFLLGLLLFLKAYLHQDYKADLGGHILEGSLITWGIFLFLLGGLHLEFFNSKVWTPLAFPGTLSYGGYLIHPALLYFLWPLLTGMNEFLAFGVFGIATFTVAYPSYRFFEVPVNLWVRRVLHSSSFEKKGLRPLK
ncbi:MAG TPA: acyltransferase [bacterium]|nr:acyltransferase [bacterium]